MREHLKIVMEKPENSDLYMKLIIHPIAKGTFHAGKLHISIGAQLFAAAKPDGDVRPVQNPDSDRLLAAGLLCHSVFHTSQAIQYFEHGYHGLHADAQISQRCMSRNGCDSPVSGSQEKSSANWRIMTHLLRSQCSHLWTPLYWFNLTLIIVFPTQIDSLLLI